MIGTWKFRPSAEKALGSAGDGQRQVSLVKVRLAIHSNIPTSRPKNHRYGREQIGLVIVLK